MSIKKLSNQFISSLNNLLYDSKQKASYFIRIITFFASIGGVSLLIYIYGFEPGPEIIKKCFSWLDIIFIIYLLTYIARLLYAFQRARFILGNKIETFLMALIAINGVLNLIFDTRTVEEILNFFDTNYVLHYYRIAISLFMFFILGLEFTKFNVNLGTIKVAPSTTFVLSFLVLIGSGTGLLMLPAMTATPGSMNFLDALFTSVSASCVTGLIVVDTATFFTYKGQVVILLLIQLGGFGIVSFASFFATFVGSGVGIKHHAMLQDFTSSESLNTAKSLLRQIVIITFVVESIAFVLLYFTWGGDIRFNSLNDKIFFTAFHAVSAFCNAGFSLFTNNLYEPFVRDSYIFHLVIAVTVILGGIGFNTIQDVLAPSSLRKRLQKPWLNWKLSSKIAIGVSVVLLIAGTIGIFFLEKHNTLADKNLIEMLIASFFQSSITRTAGFNTIDISQLLAPTLVLMMFLMFIGGSSNSIAGGIKTSTLYLIIASTVATIKGREKIEIGGRFIPKTLLFRALSVFFFAASINIIGVFVLAISEPKMDIVDLAFEQISAFGTVGLSTGVTGLLSNAGKIMIIISMFLGRVGILTFAYALITPSKTMNYKYPKAHLMVG